MTINLTMPATHQLKPRITVVGVGGAGGNAVNNMITSHLEGVEFVVANTDAQALAQSLSERRIQLGTNITQGLGAGSRPDVGRAAAEEAMDEIVDHLQGSNMVFITAGMGGGTGTGGGPVIAQAAREQGILTVAVVTKPFNFEGVHRMRRAEDGLQELQQYVDTLIIIPNQNLFRVANEKTTFSDAFKMADDVLYSGVRGVTDLMVMPGLINLDFADVRTVMAEMGTAMMGTGEAEGERRAVDSAESAISNPLLDDVSMKGAQGVLINITGGYDMTLFEVDEAANRIREEVDPEANIIFGSTFDESLAGRMRVSVVATGIQGEMRSENRVTSQVSAPTPQPLIARLQSTVVASEYRDDESAEPSDDAVEEPDTRVDAEPVAAMAMAENEPAGEQVTADRVSHHGFIPPAPVEPGARKPLGAGAEPFAAAAMANGAMSKPPAEPRRFSTLFERVTGSGRVRQPQTMPEPQPELESVLETAAARDRVGEADTMTLPRVEEDLLDIPAFLRRQAN